MLAALFVDSLPALARFLYGPEGAAALAEATGRAQSLFGSADPALLKSRAADGAGRAALRQALLPLLARLENEERQRQQAELLALISELVAAQARDGAGARPGGRGQFRADLLAYAAIAGFLGCLVGLFVVDLPGTGANKDMLMIMFGNLATLVGMVYTFEFGSSRGSTDKNGQMSTLLGMVKKTS
ncbi:MULTISPECIES: hypothetical protein [Azospirillaceae]|uniref:hypothetical protein n=1 Tax=Azospirillaceae TaxID=2829815 RepID=UPI000B73656F|nr:MULTISPECIES: hypothetical protein [Azospirillaceae]MDG5496983.1 hypothetical protein [Niveispirillum sp. BGYR6]SNS84041.1 hypothetical protein SAMN05880556_11338 [Azospirillum sp. RU38E]SNT01329.1 hypothetical protein SAMN05880591_11337 [Azospirillum sp. RU37A]